MAKAKGKKKPETTVKGVEVPIKWNSPDNITSRFASNMIIQTIEDVFKISFFEVKPEIRLDKNQKIQEEIQADCVASIIVTANKLPSFINALKQHCDKYIELKSQIETEIETDIPTSIEPPQLTD